MFTLDVPAPFFWLYPAQLLLFINPDHITEWINNKRSINESAKRNILIYDGLCNFCKQSVVQLKVMDMFNTLKFVDFNEVTNISELHPDLSKEAASKEMYLIEPSGNIFGGFFAFRRLCFSLPMMYPLFLIFYFPTAGFFGPLVYKIIAKYRRFIPSKKSCTVENPSD